MDKWDCNYCGEVFSSEEEADEHEKNCPSRPVNHSTREVGNVLEGNVEYLFRTAGFEVERNVRVASYEIDVFAKFGDRKIVVECKNYQKSSLVIRNLVHQWSSKNKLINANKVILVVYGKKIKASDRKLASKFDIDLWGEEEFNDFFSLIMDPDALREQLLKRIALKPVKITAQHQDLIEYLALKPILADEEEDVEEIRFRLTRILKIFIRTRLRLKGTTWEERDLHIKLFERGIEESSYKEAWPEIKSRLKSSKLLSEKLRKKYLGYMDDLQTELDSAKEYFSGGSEEIIKRKIRARLTNYFFEDECLFGFDEDEVVKVNRAEDGKFVLSVMDVGEVSLELLNWILTYEGKISVQKLTEGNQTKTFEVGIWIYVDIGDTVEAVYRILDEYYGWKKDQTFRDFSLATKKKGCFIATAAYGTPFAEEINILRVWRDRSLLHSSLGKRFVDFYYRHSPLVADFIAERPALRFLVRKSLAPYCYLLNKIYSKKRK